MIGVGITRAIKRRRMPIWLFVILFLLCSPVLIPWGLVSYGFEKRRMRKAAESFRCISCGKVLGVAALALADRVCMENMEELRERHPGVRWRIVRTLHAICPACGTKYTYRERERTFVVEAKSKVE